MTVLIVGAGLAGLTCARHLHQQQIPVTVLEAADDVGGRVRSDHVEGFTLDRGFQVLFDAYPAVRRNLDLDALKLQAFDPGAIICRQSQQRVLTDPLRDRNWSDVSQAALTAEIPIADKIRTLRLALKLRGQEGDQDSEPDTQSTLEYLRAEGFSERTIDTFFRPFFGGIFLSRDLSTSAAAFRFYFRMLAAGQTTLPAAGIGAITQQLAAPLRAAGAIRCNARVAALLRDGDQVTGVRLDDGEEIAADAVVLATDGPSARALADLAPPEGALQSATVYLAGLEPIYNSRKIALNAAPDALVNNAQLLTNVAPSYAPEGRHLLSAVVLKVPELDDGQLVVEVMRDLRQMFAGNEHALQALMGYYPLKVYRIRYAQFPQPAGIYGKLPENRTEQPGLYVAAEWTEASSINGAMTSGERCAALVGSELRQRVASV
jgi:phytoene dehydrogenase-like protein